MDASRRRMVNIALYMATQAAAKMQNNLLCGGVPADTVVSIVSHASTKQERCLETTLGALADCIQTEKVQHPAILLMSWNKGVPAAGLASTPHQSRALSA
ncbi:MAG: hypothetical protein HRU31_19200 [Rhodobacteraceae bacterium]|nr:hypothetical protein [Paracoccaceae bacterium]